MAKFNSKGYVLIEALLATVILSVSLTLIIQSFLSSLKASVYSAGYSTAVLLLENKMSELMQRGFVEESFSEEGTFLEPYEKYEYAIKTEQISDEPSSEMLHDVTLDVFWKSGKKKNKISLTTYLLGPLDEDGY